MQAGVMALPHLESSNAVHFSQHDFCSPCQFVRRGHNTWTPRARVHIKGTFTFLFINVCLCFFMISMCNKYNYEFFSFWKIKEVIMYGFSPCILDEIAIDNLYSMFIIVQPILCALHVLTYLALTTALWDRSYYYSHLYRKKGGLERSYS